MWKSGGRPCKIRKLFPQAYVNRFPGIFWGLEPRLLTQIIHRKLVLFPQHPVEKNRCKNYPWFSAETLKKTVDVGLDVPDIFVEGALGVLQHGLYLFNGVKHRGMVPSELPANVR